ncbi:MAG TPA: hypothetical protein QGG47_11565 [Acidobacteriota bacterium]|nr:hypothetical protein [Acidobacteriota bacterium]
MRRLAVLSAIGRGASVPYDAARASAHVHGTTAAPVALLRLRGVLRPWHDGRLPNIMFDEDGYEIDYEHIDVHELMEQVRARAAARSRHEPTPATADAPDLLQQLRDNLDLDDEQPYELQRALRLAGEWNVAPDDLRVSHDGPIGALITTVRRLARPLVKVFVNLDAPLYKQFKINLGMAHAIHQLMLENAALRCRVEELSERIDELAERTDGVSTGTHC